MNRQADNEPHSNNHLLHTTTTFTRPQQLSIVHGVPAIFPLLLIICTASLLFVIFHSPPEWTLDIGAPGDAYYLANFLPPEVENFDPTTPPALNAPTFRWTGPNAQLLLHGASAGPLALSLRLHGDALTQAYDSSFQVQRDGQPLTTFVVADPGWRVYGVLLPAGAVTTRGMAPVPLDLRSTTHSPGSHEGRELGVPIDWLRLTPLTGKAASITASLQRALLLTWSLMVLAGGVWFLDQALLSNGNTLSRMLRVGGIMVLVTGGVITWAWRDPYMLALLAPLLPWLLVPGTIALVGRCAVGGSQRVMDDERRQGTDRHWPRVKSQWLIVLPLVIAHLALFAPLPVSWRGAAALVLLGLPGVLLVSLLFRSERDPLVQVFLGLCGGLALPIPLLLALQAFPGPLSWWLVLLACDGLIAGMSILLLRQPPPKQTAPLSHHPYELLGLVMVLTVLMRLPFLGLAEFQGDEARPMILAAGVLQGQADVLLLNSKGPVEVLLPVGPMALTGQINEWVARIPNALAGVGVVLGAYLLACRLFNDEQSGFGSGTWVGIVAASFLAVDGLQIGFSRILQYQSVVVLMSTGMIWCCWRVYEGVAHQQYYLISAAAFMAIGLLAHYDAVLAMPVLGWLIIAIGWRQGWRGKEWLRQLAAPLLVGAGLVCSFYLPFVLNEQFGGSTASYLTLRLQGYESTTLFANHLVDYFYNQTTFYNTTYEFYVGSLILTLGPLVWMYMYIRPRMLGRLLAIFWLASCVLAIRRPDWFIFAGVNWAMVAFRLPLTGLALSPGPPASLRTLVWWGTPPFLAMMFIIGDPGTHFYSLNVPVALIISLAVVRLGERLRGPLRAWLRLPLALGGLGLLAIATLYIYLIFVRPIPEYQRIFPAGRLDIYTASYGDTRPSTAYFGFPHRDGWKIVGDLYRQGVLQGDYNTNRKVMVTSWYTNGNFRCAVDPEYYFAAWSHETHKAKIIVPEGYDLFGYIMVDDTRAMDIYSRAPVEAPPQVFDLDTYTDSFDRQPIDSFSISRSLGFVAPQHPLEETWPQGITLHGYDLDQTKMNTPTPAKLSLYWGALETAVPNLRDYVVFVEVVDENGVVVGSPAPHCNPVLPTEWPESRVNRTDFYIDAANLPPGSYTLRTGLHHTTTGNALTLADGAAGVPFAIVSVE